MIKSRGLVAVAAVVMTCAGLFPMRSAGASAGSETMTSAGPLGSITIYDTLECDVADNVLGHVFYAGSACATYIAINGVTYDTGSLTPVSQTLTGSGTSADPYKIDTVVDVAGTGVRLSQEDAYVVGDFSYTTVDAVENTNPNPVNVIIYHGADCYVQGDAGLGDVGTDGSVACVNPETGASARWTPGGNGWHHFEGNYYSNWAQASSGADLPDTCDCANVEDNGASISYGVSVDPNSTVIGIASSFGVTEGSQIAQVAIEGVVDPAFVTPGAIAGWNLTVSNPGSGATGSDTTVSVDVSPGMLDVAAMTRGASNGGYTCTYGISDIESPDPGHADCDLGSALDIGGASVSVQVAVKTTHLLDPTSISASATATMTTDSQTATASTNDTLTVQSVPDYASGYVAPNRSLVAGPTRLTLDDPTKVKFTLPARIPLPTTTSFSLRAFGTLAVQTVLQTVPGPGATPVLQTLDPSNDTLLCPNVGDCKGKIARVSGNFSAYTSRAKPVKLVLTTLLGTALPVTDFVTHGVWQHKIPGEGGYTGSDDITLLPLCVKNTTVKPAVWNTPCLKTTKTLGSAALGKLKVIDTLLVVWGDPMIARK